MQKNYLFLSLVFALLSLNSCKERKGPGTEAAPRTRLDGPRVDRDLSALKKEGVLRAILVYNSTSYFLYRGQAMGFEYEMSKALARDLGLQLEVVVAPSIDSVFDYLNSGRGDLIAYGLTVTEPRQALISFTDYLYTTHQALVQRKPEGWRRMARHRIDQQLVKDAIELIGDTVHVHRRSSYFERLENLSQEIGGAIVIDTVEGNYNTEDLIAMVVDGKIRYTVADYNVAAINQTFFPSLDVETPISLSQRIAWGVRKNAPELEQAINLWLADARRGSDYHYVYNKYYKHKKAYRRRVESELYSKNSGIISPYDELIQQYADSLGWDWRLLASVVYQESRFDPSAESWAGAMGLLQIMPETANDLGLADPSDPAASLEAGSRYLDQLYQRFAHIPDSVQAQKFALASYNCGYGHVLDAQRLAARAGLDSTRYDRATEIYLLKLGEYQYYSRPEVRYGPVRGREPYHYVRQIFARYQHYRRLVPQYLEADSLQI